MKKLSQSTMLKYDREHIWHPYSSMIDPLTVYPVVSASGVYLKLADGRELIDGMSSWWSVIHGYNHPRLNSAAHAQIDTMAHVMFGGLTHWPATELASRLVRLTPAPQEKVFFSDSGSVSVEVAIKMAIQFWQSRGQTKKYKLLSLRHGYHGDTSGAMSVCDPVTGMHELFTGILPKHYFADAPCCGFDDPWDEQDIASLASILEDHNDEIAAVIMEPIVQGAGGMRFYSPQYLRRTRQLCDRYEVLLILDEIATGFGRTGTLFACEQAGIAPDIMCLGKALTGGYMTLAVTLTTTAVSDAISNDGKGVFMHGPTFMGNPLACAIANASIDLLMEGPWQQSIKCIEQWLRSGLSPCTQLERVVDVRILGTIGVVELDRPVDMRRAQHRFVDKGVWIRPFGKLLYIMPPYIITEQQLAQLTSAIVETIEEGITL
ncbi:MAG: adenosylmethionine--8-amino-7-oxononanoate transaminase [Gammaproteobacteria bacterium]|nr:adenosylmethionine--8-amino-7-oxononanoate transaminase [Gammaproteobacteria bacterium]